ncbi:radical SAM/SPASM domain-containing protein [uncultured Thomasclavelia sp.]|uniref:radical SAM/SPASM domain-containing protein n=1 Tax=uncultured Thomasclavelia sp. TaxID=3025759 RepID=UPI00280C2FD4|nr:radical SAM protein [uncultured Thomasclavelia sp.]
MYKKSQYTFVNNVDNGMMLYNSKTGAVAFVENRNKQQIMNMLQEPDQHENDEFFSQLHLNGFIVDQSVNEYEEIKNKYERTFNNKNIIQIVMLPAEVCNCTCQYCFVYDYGGKIMKETIYNRVLNYIQNTIHEMNCEENKPFIKISWFGGEPLLEKERIFSFMEQLHMKFHESCRIESSIITNGYYLTYDVFMRLINSGVNEMQITFDGVKEDHDKVRKLRDGSGTFDVILSNLKEIMQSVPKDLEYKLLIRINFMKHTYKSIYGLIDQLLDIIKDNKNVLIYCRPIYDIKTKREDIDELRDNILTIEDGFKIQSEFSSYIMNKQKTRRQYAHINDYLPLPLDRWCGEEQKYNIIIGADGKIYFCDTLIGNDDVAIGFMNEEGRIIYNESSEEWRKSVFDMDNFKKCSKCKCLPICIGSCKRERLQGNPTPCLFEEKDILFMMEQYYKNEIQPESANNINSKVEQNEVLPT